MIEDLQIRPLSPGNFAYIRDLAVGEAAIVIEKGKEYLVETRLSAIATRHRCASVDALVDQLRVTRAPSLVGEIIDALTTNETLFFRDLNPFDALRDHVIPRFISTRPGQPLTIWSAAASTGQEPYSLAMLLAEHFPSLPSRILATDISPSVIKRARAGLYQQLEVNRGLPAKLLVKYFRQTEGAWQLDAQIRRRVDFSELNLARPWPSTLPLCHLVFIRNVMIYFDLEVRRQILRQVRNVLAPGGYLVLGGAETTVMLDPGFTPVPVGRATFYQLNAA